jgi:hypothetical protein
MEHDRRGFQSNDHAPYPQWHRLEPHRILLDQLDAPAADRGVRELDDLDGWAGNDDWRFHDPSILAFCGFPIDVREACLHPAKGL